MLEKYFSISSEVSEALNEGKPIVALESTIITHGMPYPENYSTAKSVENVIRSYGVIPATIAIIKGIIHIGLTNNEILNLSKITKTKNIYIHKCTRRDLPYVLSKKLYGSTTVAATMYIASLIGINIFVTGGIGGVHRGVNQTWDISADLIELSNTNVTVICAGIKSILDISKTLEYLETHGVSITTLGQKEFPAFFISNSGIMSPLMSDSVDDIAKLIYISKELKFKNGTLVAVPVPKKQGAKYEIIENATKQALKELNEQKIEGRDVTPFLLQRVNELTKGKSLESNIALIKNNAMIGAKLALKLYEMNSLNNKINDCLIFGGSMIDIIANPLKNIKFINYTSNPGYVKYNYGGVGRNISECMARLGNPPTLISCFGNDIIGKSILNHCQSLNIDVSKSFINNDINDSSTNSYVAIMDNNNDLHCAVCQIDLSLMENDIINPNKKNYYESMIKQTKFIVLDGNLKQQTLEYLLNICKKYKKPVWYETISIEKSTKIIKNGCIIDGITYIKPNELELFEILEKIGYNKKLIDVNANLETLKKYLIYLIEKGIENIVLSRGDKGVLIASNIKNRIMFDEINVNRIDSSEILNTNGAGDNLVGGTIVGLLQGKLLKDAIQIGLHAASMCLKSHKSVNPELKSKL